MPALRSDSALIAFRRKLEALNYDMRAWRAQQVGWGETCTHSKVKLTCVPPASGHAFDWHPCSPRVIFVPRHLSIFQGTDATKGSRSGQRCWAV